MVWATTDNTRTTVGTGEGEGEGSGRSVQLAAERIRQQEVVVVEKKGSWRALWRSGSSRADVQRVTNESAQKKHVRSSAPRWRRRRMRSRRRPTTE